MYTLLKVLSHGLRARGPCNIIFRILAASIHQSIIIIINLKRKSKYYFKSAIAIVHVLIGVYMCVILEYRCWIHVEV